MNHKTVRLYLTAAAAFWLVFGLITTFYPPLMDLFLSDAGIAAKSAFSDHVWRHDGLDIIAVCVLLFALSREVPSRNMIQATAIASLMPTIGITYSLLATPYWNPLFIIPGLCCLGFAVWGFLLSNRVGPLASPFSAEPGDYGRTSPS